jgi:hypothetical protein
MVPLRCSPTYLVALLQVGAPCEGEVTREVVASRLGVEACLQEQRVPKHPMYVWCMPLSCAKHQQGAQVEHECGCNKWSRNSSSSTVNGSSNNLSANVDDKSGDTPPGPGGPMPGCGGP